MGHCNSCKLPAPKRPLPGKGVINVEGGEYEYRYTPGSGARWPPGGAQEATWALEFRRKGRLNRWFGGYTMFKEDLTRDFVVSHLIMAIDQR